jgi:hypothetical protein
MVYPKEQNDSYRLRFLEAKKSSFFSRNDLFGVFVISSIGLSVLNLVLNCLLYGTYLKLSNKPTPSLVQLASGQSITVTHLGNKERTPEVILEFVKSSLSTLMTWNGKFPSSNSNGGKLISDPGVEVRSAKEVGKRTVVTTPAYQGAFTLSEDFRKEFLQELGKLTPSGVFQGQTEVIFVPIEIQKPIQIETGKWRVRVVANLLVLDQKEILGTPITFNKEVFVQAVEPPEYQTNVTGIALIVQHIRASGLEIYAIRDLIKEEM